MHRMSVYAALSFASSGLRAESINSTPISTCRDLQLWLKVVLTEEEYAAAKAGEERAAVRDRRAGERLKNYAL